MSNQQVANYSLHTTTATQNDKSESLCSIIDKGTTIRGEFSSSQNMLIQGHLIGNITCEKQLTIEGVVEGSLTAPIIVIAGKVEGEVFCNDTITLLSSAKITGKMTSVFLEIEEGAEFNGTFSCRNV